MCLANKYSVRYSSSFSESNAEESSFQSGVLYWLGGWLPAQRSGGQSSKQFWRWVHCHGCYGFCLLLTVVPRRCTVRLWKGGGHLGMNACVSQFPSPSTYTLALVGWYMLLVTDIHILLIIQTTWMHTITNHCMHPHIQIHSCCMLAYPIFLEQLMKLEIDQNVPRTVGNSMYHVTLCIVPCGHLERLFLVLAVNSDWS